MFQWCWLCLGLAVLAHTATINHIPVRVVYEEHNRANVVSRRNLEQVPELEENLLPQGLKSANDIDSTSAELKLQGVKNLEERPQVEAVEDPKLHALKNLLEKPQLSQEELRVADKHLPVAVEALRDELVPAEANPEPSEASAPEASTKTPEPQASTEAPLQASSDAPAATQSEESTQNPNIVLFLQLAQKIIDSGLLGIRNRIENLIATGELPANGNYITGDQWDRLNSSITDLFSNLLDSSKKAEKVSIVQVVEIGFLRASNNFLKEIESTTAAEIAESKQAPADPEPIPPPAPAQTSGSSSTQRPPNQNLIGIVSTGFNRIRERIRNVTRRGEPSSTTSGPGLPSAAPNAAEQPATPGPIQTIINLFTGNNGGQNTATAGDEQQPGQQNVFQNVASAVSTAISNINPFNPQGQAPAGGSDQQQPDQQNVFQNIASSVSQAVSNINPFNQQQGQAPAGGSDTQQPAGGQNNVFQNIATSVSQAVSNINPFNQGQGQGSGDEQQTTGGPFVQIQNGIQNLFGGGQKPPSPVSHFLRVEGLSPHK